MLAQNRLIEQIEHLKKQFVQMDLPGITNLVNTERLAVMIEEALEKEVLLLPTNSSSLGSRAFNPRAGETPSSS